MAELRDGQLEGLADESLNEDSMLRGINPRNGPGRISTRLLPTGDCQMLARGFDRNHGVR